MATLRKSCHGCAKSKRHCTVQLPSCARCVQRGLTCTYDLQPFSGAELDTKCSANLLLKGIGFDTTGYCVLDRAEAYNKHFGSDVDPSYCPPGHEEAQQLIRHCYLNIPDMIASQRPATFVHPKLQMRAGRSYLSLARGPLNSAMTLLHLQTLAEVDVGAVPLEEELTALQVLLIFTAPMLVSEQRAKRDIAEPWLKVAEVWAQHLLTTVSVDMLKDRTPWQQWLFAESIRRTILMAYVLICCFNAWEHGYCSNWLLLESLPFDGRPGLWMAESPQAWIAAAGSETGKHVGVELTSVHEFGGKMKDVDSTFCGDTFLSMMAMAHNGSAAHPNNLAR